VIAPQRNTQKQRRRRVWRAVYGRIGPSTRVDAPNTLDGPVRVLFVKILVFEITDAGRKALSRCVVRRIRPETGRA
jgi:hypothetical protein